MLYYILVGLVRPLFFLLFRPVIYGKENLRIQDKAIIIANHKTMLDPVLLALITPRVIHFMAKKEIFDTKIGNIFFRSLCAFPVNRKAVDLQSLKNALQVLNKGKVFGIFPEGKREVSNSLDEFEKGTALLAIRSGAPVVPVYIHPDTYKKWRPLIMVGKPIDVNSIVANATKSAMIDIVTDDLYDAVDALRIELEELYCE